MKDKKRKMQNVSFKNVDEFLDYLPEKDEMNFLEKGSRKQVFSKTLFDIKEFDVDLLSAYLFDDLEVDEGFVGK